MPDMESLFGPDGHLLWYHGVTRATLIFFFGLTILRLSGRRAFSNMSALDIVLSVIAGSALSETMTGSAPLPSTLAGVCVLVGLHLLLSRAVAHSPRLSTLMEGDPVPLMKRGRVDPRARKRHLISEADLEEALRQNGLAGLDDIAKVKAITLEPNGKITIVKKA